MNDKLKIVEADCICTKQLSLVDDQGRQRAVLMTGTTDNDYVVFHMNDAAGRPRVTIQLDDAGTSIMLFTEQNAPAISIGLIGDVGNGITIGRPGDGRPHVMLGVPGKDGYVERGQEPSLVIISSKGDEIVITPKGE